MNIANSANKMWGTCCWVQLEIAMHYYLLSLLSTIYNALVDSEAAGAWCCWLDGKVRLLYCGGIAQDAMHTAVLLMLL